MIPDYDVTPEYLVKLALARLPKPCTEEVILIAVVDGLKGFRKHSRPPSLTRPCRPASYIGCAIPCPAHRIRSGKRWRRNSRRSIGRQTRTRRRRNSMPLNRVNCANVIQTWCEVGVRNGIWSSRSWRSRHRAARSCIQRMPSKV